MNYKEIMRNDKTTFAEYYEHSIKNIQNEFVSVDGIQTSLCEKRKMGLLKYGDKSFQASFENAMKSPTQEHALEELLDAINYMSHEIFKRKVLGEVTSICSNILEDLSSSYDNIKNLIHISVEKGEEE